LPVLTYHRVLPAAEAADACPSTVSATPDDFEEQMRFLAGARRVIGAEQLRRVRRGEEELPPGSAVVTFDDGYADFAEHAWPVLRDLGLDAILFVPTGVVSGDPRAFWWDRLWRALVETDRPAVADGPDGELPLGSPALARAAYRQLRDQLKQLPHLDLVEEVDRLVAFAGEPRSTPRTLGWDELRALRDDGLAIASHTVTHPLLTQVAPAARRAELVGSRDALERELGEVPAVLAYPSGACDAAVAAEAAAAGYDVAFTTRRGVNDVRHADWHRLDRINVGPRTTTAVLRAQLAPRVADLARGLT
jgi:peptidoglycan/xylan/chitin deacetylase (PgdA/CDA1 family)